MLSAERIDQCHLTRVSSHKTGIQVQNASEDCHRHPGDDDRGACGTEPYDKERGKRRLRKAVQDDQIGFQYLRKLLTEPQKHSSQHTEERHQKETDESLI